MGFLDKLKGNKNEIKNKAADLAASQNDKIDAGLDKAAGLVNKATGGKFEDKIDSATEKAKDAADKLAEDGKA